MKKLKPRLMKASKCPQGKLCCIHTKEHEEITERNKYGTENYYQNLCSYHECEPKDYQTKFDALEKAETPTLNIQ